MRRQKAGTVLVLVLLLLTVALTLVPLMILFTQSESKWGVKQGQTMTAFHLAEAAVERGYLELTRSTSNWQTIQDGGVLDGYAFDQRYTDIQGGDYAIYISSGTGEGQAVILGVGRESTRKEVRSVRAVYSTTNFGNIAIQSGNGVAITGNNFQVHWGAILTPKAITVNGRVYPQLWSATSIDEDTNGALPANCDSPDCCHWHSYSANIPPLPSIDLDSYKVDAQASPTSSSDSDCGDYYSSGDKTIGKCTDTTGRTFYVSGNLTVTSAGGGSYILGNVVVIGNMSLPSGTYGDSSETVSLPTNAWKQYCRDWSSYRTTFDPDAPSSWPGITDTYLSASTRTYTVGGGEKVFVHGFLYVGGDVTNSGGGGNGAIVGIVYVGGTANLASNSQAKIYYNASVANNMKTTTVILGRDSWEEETREFPSGI